jgi:ParB family chromosome partitioning protein
MEKVVFQDFEKALPLSRIELSERNVRKTRQKAGLEELKASIQGIDLIQPVIVFERGTGKKYKLIVGQRRYEAFKELGRTTIPALIIRPMSARGATIVSFDENAHKRDLPYDDTIAVCSELFEELGGPKFDRIRKIAVTLAISPQTVAKYLSYRLIPKEVQQLVTEGKLSRSVAFKITTSFWPNAEKITRIAKQATRMTRSEWERLLDIGQKNPKASVEAIVEEAMKPPRVREIVLVVESAIYEHLERIAHNRNMEVDDLVKSQIEKLLEEEEEK